MPGKVMVCDQLVLSLAAGERSTDTANHMARSVLADK